MLSIVHNNLPVTLFFLDEELHDFSVVVGDDPDPFSQDNTECLHKCGGYGQGKSEFMFCMKPIAGRYISVHILGEAKLCLCEVNVYKWGGKIMNIYIMRITL